MTKGTFTRWYEKRPPTKAKAPKTTTVVAEAKKELAVAKVKQEIKKSKIPKQLYPASAFISMRYSYIGQMTTGATPTALLFYQRLDSGSQILDLFSLNSITFPRPGGQTVGASDTRPQGYDQAALAYSRYKVYGTKVSVQFTDVSADGTWVGAKVSPFGETQRLNGLYINNLVEKRGVFKPISISNTGQQVVKRSWYFTPYKTDGITKSQFKNDIVNYDAAFGSNPSRMPKIEFAIASADATVRTCQYQVTIDYLVRLYGRLSLATSNVPEP